MCKKVKVWVDADSCPRLVRQYVIKKAEALRFLVAFAANRNIPIECKDENARKLFSMALCHAGHDAADDVIVENAGKYDAAITRDIPLAARLVKKGVCVMNDRGVLFTDYNIEEKLNERDFNMQLVEMGFGGNNETAYSEKELQAFARCFDKKIKMLMLQAAINP